MGIDAALHAITDRHGSFFRREALALGADDRMLRRETRAGRLVRIRHGAYTFPELWWEGDDVARHALLTRAVTRSIGPGVAASHHSATSLYDMALWDVPLEIAHVTRLDGGAGRTESGVTHHEGLWLDGDIVTVDGTLAVTPVRAALESASLSGVERGLVTVDSGLRSGLFTPQQLRDQHALMRSWPASQCLNLVVPLADPRSHSVGESRGKHLFWSQGLPMPELQFEVFDGTRLVGTTDFAWPAHRLLGEFDGRVKYERYLRPGESPGDVVFREKQREDALRRVTGWRVVRLVWADLEHPARTATRIRSMMAEAA